MKTCFCWAVAALCALQLAGEPETVTVSVDLSRNQGAVKPLHGVNDAPFRLNGKQGEMAAAGIPYVRTHDIKPSGVGRLVDIPDVFPDFEADENDPASYDFAFTDAWLKPLVEAGCKPFYRLGVTIENKWRIKAYHIHPPKDPAKWARICEHVVRHYNEGWANGYRWNVEYWEIWNEPENPAMWSGTKEEFFELYRVVANHLKARFPDIRIGGYASCGFYAVDDKSEKMKKNLFYQGFVGWFEDFCRYVQDPKTKSPLDFFSWHLYVYQGTSIERIRTHARYVRQTLDAAGLEKTESIFNEWNVFPKIPKVNYWDAVKTHQAAALVAASFCLMQEAPVDKAMYYRARPDKPRCGLFYYPSEKTTPCYEAFRAWNELAKLGQSVGTTVDGSAAKSVYASAATDGTSCAVLLANATGKDQEVRIEGLAEGGYSLFRVDAAHSQLKPSGRWKAGDSLSLPAYGIVLLSSRADGVGEGRPSSSQEPITAEQVNGLSTGLAAREVVATEQVPVRVEKRDDVTFVDFGKDAFGWLSFDVPDGARGTFEVRLGEKLARDGTIDPKPGGTIRFASVSCTVEKPGRFRVPLVANARNTRGVNRETAELLIPIPEKFGVVLPFRYVEVRNAPFAVTPTNVCRTMLHWPIDMSASSFRSSSPELNRIYEMCKYTILATSFAGVYVDGDRERIPYEADAYINALGHYAIDADFELSRRTFRRLIAHPTWPTEWRQHMIFLAWTDWMYSGSSELAREFWDVLRTDKLMLPLAREDGLLVTGGVKGYKDIVDWPVGERDGYAFTPVNAVVNAFHYRNLVQMSELAAALGKAEDAAFLAARAEKVKSAFNRVFFDAGNGIYTDGEGTAHASLHANAAALAMGLVPADRKARVADFLVKKGMACSVYFAQYLLEALFEGGRGEEAIRLMAATGERTWAGMLDQGSTLAMEAWSLAAKPNQDWNHAWGTAALNVMTRYVLGVRPTKPGFGAFEKTPFLGPLRFVEGVVPTVRGPVRVNAGDR